MFNRIFSHGTRTPALPPQAGGDAAIARRASAVAKNRTIRLQSLAVQVPTGNLANPSPRSFQASLHAAGNGRPASAGREPLTDSLAADIRRRLPLFEASQAQRFRRTLDHAVAMRNPESRAVFVDRLHTLVAKAERAQAARQRHSAFGQPHPAGAQSILRTHFTREAARRKENRILSLGLKILRARPQLAKRYLTLVRNVLQRQNPATQSPRLARMAQLVQARTRHA